MQLRVVERRREGGRAGSGVRRRARRAVRLLVAGAAAAGCLATAQTVNADDQPAGAEEVPECKELRLSTPVDRAGTVKVVCKEAEAESGKAPDEPEPDEREIAIGTWRVVREPEHGNLNRRTGDENELEVGYLPDGGYRGPDAFVIEFGGDADARRIPVKVAVGDDPDDAPSEPDAQAGEDEPAEPAENPDAAPTTEESTPTDDGDAQTGDEAPGDGAASAGDGTPGESAAPAEGEPPADGAPPADAAPAPEETPPAADAPPADAAESESEAPAVTEPPATETDPSVADAEDGEAGEQDDPVCTPPAATVWTEVDTPVEVPFACEDPETRLVDLRPSSGTAEAVGDGEHLRLRFVPEDGYSTPEGAAPVVVAVTAALTSPDGELRLAEHELEIGVRAAEAEVCRETDFELTPFETLHGSLAEACPSAPDDLEYRLASQPAGGVVELQPDGTFTYIPKSLTPARTEDRDWFEVEVTGDGVNITQRVTITAPDGAPVCRKTLNRPYSPVYQCLGGPEVEVDADSVPAGTWVESTSNRASVFERLDVIVLTRVPEKGEEAVNPTVRVTDAAGHEDLIGATTEN
jgi:hypothetical protein